MAMVKQWEFAKMCGKTPAHVSTYIRRGKIVKSGAWIDTTFEVNKLLMEHWQREEGILPKDQTSNKDSQIPDIQKIPDIPQIPEIDFGKPKPVAPNKPNVDPGDPTSGSYQLDRKIKEAELESKEIKIRQSLFEESKSRGDFIPVDSVKTVVSILGTSFQNAYKNGANQLMLDISHRLKMTPEIEGEFKGKLITLINSSHSAAIATAKLEIELLSENMRKSKKK